MPAGPRARSDRTVLPSPCFHQPLLHSRDRRRCATLTSYFLHFPRIFPRIFQLYATPRAPCNGLHLVTGADWCLRSDVMPDSGLEKLAAGCPDISWIRTSACEHVTEGNRGVCKDRSRPGVFFLLPLFFFFSFFFFFSPPATRISNSLAQTLRSFVILQTGSTAERGVKSTVVLLSRGRRRQQGHWGGRKGAGAGAGWVDHGRGPPGGPTWSAHPLACGRPCSIADQNTERDGRPYPVEFPAGGIEEIVPPLP